MFNTVEFKEKVLEGDDKNKTFVIINQKGIDPVSLDVLAKVGSGGTKFFRPDPDRVPTGLNPS